MVFVLMVFGPFAANLFYSNTELLDNRPLKEKPVRFDRNFSKDYEAYYNDTFAGRKKLVSKYIKLQQKLKIDTGQYFTVTRAGCFMIQSRSITATPWLIIMVRFALTKTN